MVAREGRGGGHSNIMESVTHLGESVVDAQCSKYDPFRAIYINFFIEGVCTYYTAWVLALSLHVRIISLSIISSLL